MITRRTRYVLVLQPEPGVDGIRALRWVLKSLLRRWGLRCVDIHEEKAKGADDHAA